MTSPVRFLMVSVEFFHWRLHYGPGVDSGPNKNECHENFAGEWRRQGHRADNFATFTCRLSWNLGAPTSWNLQGL